MATFTVEEQLDLLIKKLFYGVAKGGPSDNYNFTNEAVDSFLAVKPSDIWTNAGSIPTTPPSTTNSNVEVYVPNAGANQNAPLQLTAVTESQNAGNYTNFRKQWVALDSNSDRLKNWIGPGYGAGYAVRVFVGGTGWDGTDSDATAKGIQEISFGSNAAADWFFDYEAGVLLWTNENLNEGVAGDFQQSVDFTTTTSLISNGDVVYIKAQRYIGGTGLGSASNVTVSSSADNTDFPIVFTDGASGSASLKIDSADAPTYNPYYNVLSTAALTASVSFSTGSLAVNGNTTLGDASSDTVDVNARFTSDLLPSANDVKDLGSSTLKWAEVHATTFTGNLTGDVTGNADTATKIASITNSDIVLLTATQTLTNKTLTAPTLTAPVLGTPASGDLTNCTFPTLNQDTTGNATTATTATNIAGGALGSVPYQSGSNTTAFLTGNATTTKKYLQSVGNGAVAAAPTFAEIAAADVSGLGTMATQGATAVAITGGDIDGTAIGSTTAAAGTFTNLVATGAVINGNLTVSGDVIQANSTAVNFEDNVLQLAVPRGSDNAITAENGTSAPDSGLDFVKVTSVGSIDEFASMRYDVAADKIKFTRHADGGSFTESDIADGADNVASLKFNVTDTNTGQQDQANGTTTMNAADEANASSVRSLGAVAKCSITITTDGSNVGDNYAPAEAGAVGYPIKHNLGTQSVFVVAIQTVNNSGVTMNDPQPVYCKYIPEDDETVRVSVGVTQEQEQYDIIVIG